MTRRARGLALLAAPAALVSPAAAPASPVQVSTFQDDGLLVNGTAAQQARTLDTLRAFGVDRVRVTLQWRLVAPAAGEARKPDDFDGADPAACSRRSPAARERCPSPSWAPAR